MKYLYVKKKKEVIDTDKGVLLSEKSGIYFWPENKAVDNSLYSFFEICSLKETLNKNMDSSINPHFKSLLEYDILTNPVLIILQE